MNRTIRYAFKQISLLLVCVCVMATTGGTAWLHVSAKTKIQSTTIVLPAKAVAYTAQTLIGKARKGQRINVEIYEFTNRTLAKDLVSAKIRGATVRVILDATYRSDRSVGEYLSSNHIPVRYMDIQDGHYQDIDHVKLLEVGSRVLMGGVNWGSESWRTTDIDFETHDQKGFIATMFDDDWSMASGQYNIAKYDGLPQTSFLTGNRIEACVLNDIQHARTSIQLYMFGFDNRDVIRALLDAEHRGVHVTAIFDSHYEKSLDSAGYNELAHSGASVQWESPNNVLHAKVMIVDHTTIVAGSANFTQDGMEWNHELDFTITSSSMARQITKWLS